MLEPLELVDRARDDRALGRAAAGQARADHRRPDARAHRSRAFHQQSQLRQDGLCGCAGGARSGRGSGAGQRARCRCPRPPACSASNVESAADMLDAVHAGSGARRHLHLDGCGGRLPPDPDRRAEDQEDLRPHGSRNAAHGGHPRHASPRGPSGRSWSASRPRPNRSSRTRAASC